MKSSVLTHYEPINTNLHGFYDLISLFRWKFTSFIENFKKAPLM
jgi:hypothetical protein